MYEIVTLSKFPDIFHQFLASTTRHEPEIHKVVVLDPITQHWYPEMSPSYWTVLTGIDPFIFARNANLGIRAAGQNDVVLVNDDVTFTCRNSLKYLEEAAYSSSEIGIISPVISGSVGNRYQQVLCPNRPIGISISPKRLAFVCVYIKRSTINLIGELDEQFDGYGGDDDDYCYRAEQAGLKLAVTTNVRVHHGFESHSSSASFVRTMKDSRSSMMAMRQKFIAKHNTTPKY